MVAYLFRVPVFPVICQLGEWLVAARSHKELESQIEDTDALPEKMYSLVDAAGENWGLVTEHMVICPLIRRRLTKKDIIALFNTSDTAKKAGMEHPVKSLSSKRVERVAAEVAETIRTANRRIREMEQGPAEE